MSKAKEKSGLKMLAADAKARMKKGCYTNLPAGGETSGGDYYEIVKASVRRNTLSEQDRLFLEKVREILSAGDGVTNPIQRLVDQERLRGLDYSGRQRYLLEISDKFNKAKKEIEKENAAKNIN
jgi:hypothetical protein